jgi:hypothetical protein
MNNFNVLSMISIDKPGIFPSQKYFSEKNSDFYQKLVLLDYFIHTKQIETKIVLDIYSIFKNQGIKILSANQLKVLIHKVEETYGCLKHLYRFPNLEQYKYHEKLLNNRD